MLHSHYRCYVPRLEVFPRLRNPLQGDHVPSEVWCSIHTPGSIIRGRRCSVICHCPSTTAREVRTLLCDTVVKHPLTSTRLMSLCYTKRRPSHNFIYTVDYTFRYCGKNLFVHARFYLRMLMVPKSEAEILNISKLLWHA